MLPVSVLKANPEKVKQQLAKKHFKQPELVDSIIAKDEERKKVQAAFDDTQAKVNYISHFCSSAQTPDEKLVLETAFYYFCIRSSLYALCKFTPPDIVTGKLYSRQF